MKIKKERTRLGVLALVGGAVGIGFAPILVRLSETGPSATGFYRLLFALPFLWFWKARTQDPSQYREPSTRWDFILLAGTGLFFLGDLAVWHWSLQFTTVANSTLLSNIAPIFVTIGAWFLFRERITITFFWGLILAMAGSALLVAARVDFKGSHLLGDSLAIVTAIFYAGYQLMVKRCRRDFSTPTIMAWSGSVCCPAFLGLALLAHEVVVATSVKGWSVLVTLALLSHIGGQTMIAYAFGHLPASFSSLGLLLQPFIAALLAIPILGESITLLQGIGGLLIIGGLALASRVVKTSAEAEGQ